MTILKMVDAKKEVNSIVKASKEASGKKGTGSKYSDQAFKSRK